MKQITTNDLQVSITGFEFADLKGKAREKALQDHYEFMASVNEEENEQGELVPADLEYDESYTIENIEVNEYLFDLNGDILPITHYTGKHPLTGKDSIKIFGEEKMCSII
jgi:hypothetical protein